MPIFIKDELKIDSKSPFKHDKLNREPEIVNLSILLKKINSPAVIAIDSQWGTGKTEFVRMLQAYMSKDKVHTVYFNAWKSDYSEDPLIPFIAEFNIQLKEFIGTKSNWDKAKKAGSLIAKNSIPTLISIGTGGIIRDDDFKSLTKNITTNLIDKYTEQQDHIETFKTLISKILNDSNNIHPLVVLVDELDRCRPTYAIQLLERIKHIFDVKNMIFVLSIDKKQLHTIIKSIYGDKFDSSGYLRRFIDIDYRLIRPNKKLFIEYTIEQMDFKNYYYENPSNRLKNEFEFNVKSIFYLSEKFNLPLRDIQQLLSRSVIVLKTIDNKGFTYPAIIPFLIILRDKYPNLYKVITDINATCKPVIDFIIDDLSISKMETEEQYLYTYIAGHILGLKGHVDDELINHYRDLKKTNTNENNYIYEDIIRNIEKFNSFRGDLLRDLVRSIEFSENFKVD